MTGMELERVCFRYRDRDPLVLQELSLSIQAGEFVCIVGHSGCGKTTLLRLLAGLSFPDRGEVRIDGRRVEGPGTDRAVVFQEYPLFPWMTARKNVQFGIRQAGKWSRAQIRPRAEEFLARVGLSHAAARYPAQLSGGMRQRGSLARALAMDTEILLMDEPFGALDPGTRRELQTFLEALWLGDGVRKKTVVFVTHDINEAVRLADRVICLSRGGIAADLPVTLPRPRSSLDSGAISANETRKALFELFGSEEVGPC